jgi:hypothetical protein
MVTGEKSPTTPLEALERTPDGEALEIVAMYLAKMIPDIKLDQLIAFMPRGEDGVMVSASPCEENFGQDAHRLVTDFAANLKNDDEKACQRELERLAHVLKGEDRVQLLSLTPYGESLKAAASLIAEETGVKLEDLITIKPSGGGKARVVTTPLRGNFGRDFQEEFKDFARALRENTASLEQLEKLAERLINISESKLTTKELKDPGFAWALYELIGDFSDLIEINPKHLMRGYKDFKDGKQLRRNSLQPTLQNIGPRLCRAIILGARKFRQGGLGGGKDYPDLLDRVDDMEKIKELQGEL